MNANAWDYSVTKKFFDKHYTDVVQEHDLQELKSFKLKTGVDINGKAEYTFIEGWLVNKNKLKYILPQTIQNEPLRNMLPLKIKDTTQFNHQTTIYHKPTPMGLTIFKIPPSQCMEFKEWFDGFAPFKHTNPKHWKLYKGLILGSLLMRYNYRVATCPGFGKDSLATILSDLLPLDVSVYTPKSAPKLMAMLEKRLLIVDEVVDVTKDQMSALEPVIRVAGDMRTTVNNSALSVKGFTKDEYDISRLSLAFTYNELEDYMPPKLKRDKSDGYFDNTFTRATNSRFLPLRFTGELDVSQFEVVNAEIEYNKNEEYLKNWVRYTKWLMQGGFQELLTMKDFKWEGEITINNETSRMNNHFKMILRFFKVLSTTQLEFNNYANNLYNCYCSYLNMIGQETPMLVEEETIRDEPERMIYNGKQVGMIQGTVYVKSCHKEHYMKKFQGFGISETVLTELLMRSVREVVIEYTAVDGLKEEYTSELNLWLESKLTYDYEGDIQKFVPLRDMERTN